MATIDGKLKEILTKYHPDPRSAVWDCHGKWVAYHAALEEIARNAKITFDPPQVLEASGDTKCVAICVTGRINGSAVEWSIGEASPHNYRTSGKQAAYPFAMAEKRAKDRVILKLIGLHGMVYSEEESEDFKQETGKEEPPPKVSPLTEQKNKIRDALKKAPTVKDVDLILRTNHSTLEEIKEAKVGTYDALMELAETRKASLTGEKS